MLSMVTPAHGAVVLLGDDGRDRDRVELTATFDGPREARPREVEFLVDGQPVGRSTHPYGLLVAVTPGDHEVIAIPTDGSSVAFAGSSFSAR